MSLAQVNLEQASALVAKRALPSSLEQAYLAGRTVRVASVDMHLLHFAEKCAPCIANKVAVSVIPLMREN